MIVAVKDAVDGIGAEVVGIYLEGVGMQEEGVGLRVVFHLSPTVGFREACGVVVVEVVAGEDVFVGLVVEDDVVECLRDTCMLVVDDGVADHLLVFIDEDGAVEQDGLIGRRVEVGPLGVYVGVAADDVGRSREVGQFGEGVVVECV